MSEIVTKNHIKKVFGQKKKFTIIGLTGKVKAGTSDVCELLTSFYFPDRATQPADRGNFDMSEMREFKVVYRYLHHNWRPFIEISVTSVILSYLLEQSIEELRDEKIGEITMYELFESAVNEKFKERVEARLKEVHKRIRYREDTTLPKKMQEYLEGADSPFSGTNSSKIIEKLRVINSKIREKDSDQRIEQFCFCYGILPELDAYFRKELKGQNNFTQLFQNYGNNIRATGRALILGEDEFRAENIFRIPERINQILKLLRYYDEIFEIGNGGESPIERNEVFVVINNFKNIFEAFYFRCRYASFYLLSVASDEKMRRRRFESIKDYRLTELKENLSMGRKLYKIVDKYLDDMDIEEGKDILNTIEKRRLFNKWNFTDVEQKFIREIYEEKGQIRSKAYKNSLSNFVLQDVITCVENADIFVTRDFGEEDYKSDFLLLHSLARVITLIMHPGLLTPTKIERCMQVAMTAKVNSGCLSRQVGAVVTDSEYNILSLGWNDTPCGAESCIRRNLFDLFRKYDEMAYSEYELKDETFREYLEVVSSKIDEDKKVNLKGLPFAFCFKDIYQDIIKQRDQIYTKALHGEERALAICGNDKLKGGYLFTTSSPCELCAKKAKEAGIKKIYYIEQYPGISHSHIINIGPKEEWAEYILFVGATGNAYVKLYTPVMPYKDELKALGYAPSDLYKSSWKDKEDKESVEKQFSVGTPVLNQSMAQEQQEQQVC